MKAKFLIFLSLALNTPVFAVRMRDCPPTLGFDFQERHARSDEAVMADFQGLGTDEELRVILNEKLNFEKYRGEPYKGQLILVEKSKSVCRYANYAQQAAKFYTVKGRALLRVKLRAGTSNIGIYATVKDDYSAEQGLSIDPGSPYAGVVYQLKQSSTEFTATVRIGSLKKLLLTL